MKNKIMLSILGILTLGLLTGCGNYDIIDTHYTYDKAVCNYNGEKFELSISKWTDYEGEQIQIFSGGKVYLISANNCYLIDE